VNLVAFVPKDMQLDPRELSDVKVCH